NSVYILRKCLLTPLANPKTDAENFYYQKQMSTRSIIERCNGVLKMRFRCLLKDRTLHYKPEKASLIINACIVLHNMYITNNGPLYEHDNTVHNDMGMMGNQLNR
ncbi:putative nuclease HARBI1, partial [Aphis craccivora]